MIKTLKKPQGKQDEYIAAYGGLKHLEFKKDDFVTVTTLKISNHILSDLSLSLMLFFTGITRRSDTILSEQRAKIVDTSTILKKMRDQSYELLKALEKGNLKFLGEALDYGWELKKKLAVKITNPEIDEMYQTAKKAGAVGGKIAGAGAGGFLLLYVPLEKQESVRRALASYQELKFSLERDGTKAIFNIRR